MGNGISVIFNYLKDHSLQEINSFETSEELIKMAVEASSTVN
jgi:hypothetical protein